jgi:hypothetical protein
MRKAALALIVLAGLILTGCGGPGEVRYVNRTNPSETLTLNRSRTVKTKLISAVHGISTGAYTLKTAQGTSSGTFSTDNNGIKFRPQEGTPETVKFKDDGSFDYAQGTWEVAVMKKELKSIASSSTH